MLLVVLSHGRVDFPQNRLQFVRGGSREKLAPRRFEQAQTTDAADVVRDHDVGAPAIRIDLALLSDRSPHAFCGFGR